MYHLAKAALATVALLRSAGAMELAESTWDEAVEGKSVFVKFFAPWCGHCKRMKPDWDRLMDFFEDHTTKLVAEVDCSSADGKPLCESMGVNGFPTIKYGDPIALQEYEGGRDWAALKSFADDLAPTCSPSHPDLCPAERFNLIHEYEVMDLAELDEAIASKEADTKQLESDFDTLQEELHEQFKEASKKREADMKAIKDSGLDLAKAVLNLRKRESDEL